MIRAIYVFFTGVLGAIALPFAAVVVSTKARWRKGFFERLGRVPRSGRRDRVLVHMASVGEIITAAPLVDEIVRRVGPDRVVLSCVTPTGYDETRRRFPDLPVHFFPAEAGFIPTHWLMSLGVSRAVMLETELWPGFLLAAQRLGVDVAMVNGRISDRSFPRYRRFRLFVAPFWRSYKLVLAQNEEYASRLRLLGVWADRCFVTGNLKWESSPVSAPSPGLMEILSALLADRRAIVFASTHPGEEEMAMDALLRIRREFPDVVGIFAPRHKERFDEVWELLVKRDPAGARRSLPKGDLHATHWFLLDTHGELAQVFGFASAAFMGGSLTPVGGHNVLEAARVGVPVVTGPHMDNFRMEIELLESASAARRVANSTEMFAVLMDWMKDDRLAKSVGESGRRFTESSHGALARTIERLTDHGFLG